MLRCSADRPLAVQLIYIFPGHPLNQQFGERPYQGINAVWRIPRRGAVDIRCKICYLVFELREGADVMDAALLVERSMPRPPISRALNRNWLKNRTFFNEFRPRNHLSLDRRENQPLAAQSPFKNMCDNNCLDKLAAWGKGPFSVGMPKT